MSADCIRRRCDGSLFHARGPAVAKERSPNDESVHGTATVIDSADLRPALALAAADGVMRRSRRIKLSVLVLKDKESQSLS